MQNHNLYAHFEEQFKPDPGKVFITKGSGEQYTFTRVDELSAQFANKLVALGAKAGDRISTQIEKTPEALCLYYACLRAGLVYHPLNTAYHQNELSYFFENAKPFAIICDEKNQPLIEKAVDTKNSAHILTLNANGKGSLPEDSDNYSARFATHSRSENDLAALLYSSGTTGVPKGIRLSHGNLLSAAESLTDAWGFKADDILLHCLPIFHVHGLFIALGCVMLSGASICWLDNFSTQDVIKHLPASTVMMGVPTYYTRLLDDDNFTQKATANIRLFVSGSAPLKEDTFADFEKRTGHRILERYGMTETHVNTSNPLNGDRKPGTVGLPLSDVKLRIVNDKGALVAEGEIGNIQVKGPNVFKAYWRLPEKSDEAFTDNGFFDTGDKGQIDEDGYISIVGRSKDLIISGGLNIYPKEVEIVIDQLQGVKESAVIGVPHKDFGEAVVAIIAESQKDALNETHIQSQLKSVLANFKVPKAIVFLPELPRNTMGKVQKNVLREQYQGLLNTKAQ